MITQTHHTADAHPAYSFLYVNQLDGDQIELYIFADFKQIDNVK